MMNQRGTSAGHGLSLQGTAGTGTAQLFSKFSKLSFSHCITSDHSLAFGSIQTHIRSTAGPFAVCFFSSCLPGISLKTLLCSAMLLHPLHVSSAAGWSGLFPTQAGGKTLSLGQGKAAHLRVCWPHVILQSVWTRSQQQSQCSISLRWRVHMRQNTYSVVYFCFSRSLGYEVYREDKPRDSVAEG